jgi:thaumarchaeosortase
MFFRFTCISYLSSLNDKMFQQLKKPELIVPLLPLFAFAAPMVLTYFLDPNSFELLWKGRTFQLFFVWLILLELILGWNTLPKTKIDKKISVRQILFGLSLFLPTVYVGASYFGGLNSAIADWSARNAVPWASSMPLSTEYLAFTAFFVLLLFLALGKKGLFTFALPAFFLGLVGALYTIDNVFPNGQFAPLQFFVPATATLAAKIFDVMGYATVLDSSQTTTLQVTGPAGTAAFQIAWPCAGIESLLIFTVVALLFLKRIPISWKAKGGYFVLGGVVTYFINIFRIVNIFMLGMSYGVDSGQVQLFHFYYGPLASMTWIIVYPLLIIGSVSLWQRHKTLKTSVKKQPNPPAPLNPA